jgi:hypothetical protein
MQKVAQGVPSGRGSPSGHLNACACWQKSLQDCSMLEAAGVVGLPLKLSQPLNTANSKAQAMTEKCLMLIDALAPKFR